jgi:hypothetical protein
MTDPPELPQKLIDYALQDWWPRIKTVREKVCEAVPGIPGLILIERTKEGRPDVWLYGPYLLLGTGRGDSMDEIVNAGYFYGISGVWDLPQDIDGLPLKELLPHIRAVIGKSKDIKEWLAK